MGFTASCLVLRFLQVGVLLADMELQFPTPLACTEQILDQAADEGCVARVEMYFAPIAQCLELAQQQRQLQTVDILSDHVGSTIADPRLLGSLSRAARHDRRHLAMPCWDCTHHMHACRHLRWREGLSAEGTA